MTNTTPRKTDNRTRLYDDKLAYVTALMSTPQFQHCTNINSALDTLITHYIMLTTSTTSQSLAQPTVTSPTTLKSTTSLLKKVPKP